MALTLITRSALSIRGRFGCDVWQAWLNLGHHDQQDWIAAKVPERCPAQMRRALLGILYREGMRREVAAKCCATCATPTICEA